MVTGGLFSIKMAETGLFISGKTGVLTLNLQKNLVLLDAMSTKQDATLIG